MENGKKSAFTILDPNGYHEPEPGLTKREYFAGLAMQGILAHSIKYFVADSDNVAKKAIICADELLKQLES